MAKSKGKPQKPNGSQSAKPKSETQEQKVKGKAGVHRVWRCTCGAEFPEPGDWSGFTASFNHMRQAGWARAGHRTVGLVDTQTGEILVPGRNHQRAQQMGWLTPKGKGGRKPKPKPNQGFVSVSIGKGVVQPIVIELPTTFLAFYDLARAVFPEYRDATLSQWLRDVVRGYYRAFAGPLGVYELMRAEGLIGEGENERTA